MNIKVTKIEDSVPIPVRRRSPVTKLIRKMEVGQSIEFPLDQRTNIQSLASRIKAKEGKEFTVSKTGAETARIWRTK